MTTRASSSHRVRRPAVAGGGALLSACAIAAGGADYILAAVALACLALLSWRVSRQDSWTTLGSRTATTLVLAGLPLVLLIMATDFAGYFRGTAQPRFGLVLVPFIVLALTSSSHTRANDPPRRVLGSYVPYLALTTYVLCGALIGRFVISSDNPALSSALALLPGLLLFRTTLSEPDAYRLLWWLATICLLYTLLNAAALTGHADFLSSDPPGNYRHEKAWVIATAMTALSLQRRWFGLVCCIGASLYIFRQYPAATYLVIALATAMTVFGLLRAPAFKGKKSWNQDCVAPCRSGRPSALSVRSRGRHETFSHY